MLEIPFIVSEVVIAVVVVEEDRLSAGLHCQPHRGHHQLGVLQQNICVTSVALNIDPSADNLDIFCAKLNGNEKRRMTNI